jgi:biopolymer transport protein ExbB/TolQ
LEVIVSAPTAHLTNVITPFLVFQYAGPIQKIVIMLLIAAIIATGVVLAQKLSSGPRLAGGSPFLSGLRLGAPILGLLGACDSGLNMALAVANVPIPVTLKMLTPGIAESFMMLGLGVLAGGAAVVGHWVLESRIDRQVLGA